MKELTLDEFLINWLYFNKSGWNVFSPTELKQLMDIIKDDVAEAVEPSRPDSQPLISRTGQVRFLSVLREYKRRVNEEINEEEALLIFNTLNINQADCSAITSSEIEDLKNCFGILRIFNIRPIT